MKRTVARSIPLLLAFFLSAPLLHAGGGSILKSKTYSQHKSTTYGQGQVGNSSFGSHGGSYKSGSSSHGSFGGYSGKSSSYGKSSGFGKVYSGGHYGHGSSYGHAPQKVWVPGGWSLSQHKVWIPGCVKQVWHPAAFETRIGFGGHCFQVQISAGHYETVQTPGHWEWQSQRVWNQAHWQYVN